MVNPSIMNNFGGKIMEFEAIISGKMLAKEVKTEIELLELLKNITEEIMYSAEINVWKEDDDGLYGVELDGFLNIGDSDSPSDIAISLSKIFDALFTEDLDVQVGLLDEEE